MKNKISKAVATLAIAVAAVFAAPAVASAYIPSPESGPTVLAPGQSALYSFTGFVPGEIVIFTLTGEGVGPENLARVAAAATDSTSVEKEADADGEASATVTLPEDASGVYTLTAVGAESGAAEPVTIRVAATGGDDDGTTLPVNGFDGDQLLGLWIGGGVLVLAGASIAVATSVRRSRQTV